MTDKKVPTTEEVQAALGKPSKAHHHSLALKVNADREVSGTCLCGAVLADRDAILAHAEEHGMTVVV